MTRLADLTVPPADLKTPLCPHFEECGSCQLQHMQVAAYRTWKEAQLQKLLRENGLAPASYLPPVFVEEGTRRRVSVVAFWQDDVLQIGFNKFHTHDVVAIRQCLLLTPHLQFILGKLPEYLVGIFPRGGKIDVTLQETDSGAVDCVMTGLEEQSTKQTGRLAALVEECGIRRVSFCSSERDKPVQQVMTGPVQKKCGALNVDLPAGAFLQPSEKGEGALIRAVMDGLKGVGKRDKVADMFAGCGTFAGHILERTQVHAIEGDRTMAEALKKVGAGQAKFSAEERDLYKEPVTVRELRGYRAVVFDPPRAGAKEQVERLAKSDVAIVVGVSCNPATFARDAKILIAGGYKFVSLQMVDQFTWSTHCEVVGVFSR